ncbi:MAG TPA: C4-dicarboxylate ABC transporter substrate-binding protein, partial [Noviherbaspirillum sp.]|nr:C4-dicarboxylate ABC transporter substrate-binding protein [Noviherbaspirillum sp.]
MPKILRFTRFSLRDFLVASGPAVIAVVITCLLAYWLVDPSPPRVVTLSTGQDNSAYEAIGKKYAAALARNGIRVELKPSQGSQENLLRLKDEASGVDIAFVQSGSTREEEIEDKGLVSLGSLFAEPVWLFVRESRNVTRLSQLKGLRV